MTGNISLAYAVIFYDENGELKQDKEYMCRHIYRLCAHMYADKLINCRHICR